MSGLRRKIYAAANLPVIKQLIWFFDSLYFPAAYAILALLSSLLGLEIPYFSVTALIVVFTCIFSRDSKPVLVPVIMTVYGVSWEHTPQRPFSSEFFNDGGVQIFLLVCGALLLLSFLFRFIVFPNGRNFFRESKLRLGIALVTASLLLNGVFFEGYVIADLLFGIMTALAFFVCYIFFFNTLDVRKETGVYVACVLAMTAGLIFIQIIKILAFDGAVHDGFIDKDLIIAGWGMSNNVGGMLAMIFPACFYLAYKLRHGWAFYVLAFVFFGGVCLTLSRTSALVGGIILVIAAVLLSVKKSPVRKFVRIFNCAAVAVGIVVFVVFFDKIREIFTVFFDRGFDDSDRFFIWEHGFLNFLRAPAFGVGFYEPIAPDWSYNIDNWVFPDMYHNIFIQMLASCGIVGLLSYVIFVLQTIFAIRRKPTAESLFYVAVMVGIMGMSLLDNHLLRVFPAMLYSIFMLLSEREGEDGPLLLLRPLVIRRGRKRVKEGEQAENAAGAADGGAAADRGRSMDDFGTGRTE